MGSEISVPQRGRKRGLKCFQMVHTKAQRKVDRATLEELTADQLRAEAQKLGLPLSTNRSELVEAIMSFLEKSDPVKASTGELLPIAEHSAAGAEAEAPTGPRPMTGDGTAEAFHEVLASVSSVLRQQQETHAKQQEMLLQQHREAQTRQQQMLLQQQQQFDRLIQLLGSRSENVRPGPRKVSTAQRAQDDPLPRSNSSSSNVSTAGRANATNGVPTGNIVQWLAQQIPEFAGGEEDNVKAWTNRVEKVALVHGATDGVTLLAASSRLTKAARRWYDIQTGPVLESWSTLKAEILKIFDRKVPFYRAMQRVETRKWLHTKETFDQYAIEKLALMYQLNLPEEDSIHLLIGGITQSSLRATALSLTATSVDAFLERMRHVTEGISEAEKKPATVAGGARGKDVGEEEETTVCRRIRAG